MFAQVKMTMGKVEERLWSIIRNFATLGRDQPAMLVNAVRIIELQEMVDRQLEASGKGERSFAYPCLPQRRRAIFSRSLCSLNDCNASEA